MCIADCWHNPIGPLLTMSTEWLLLVDKLPILSDGLQIIQIWQQKASTYYYYKCTQLEYKVLKYVSRDAISIFSDWVFYVASLSNMRWIFSKTVSFCRSRFLMSVSSSDDSMLLNWSPYLRSISSFITANWWPITSAATRWRSVSDKSASDHQRHNNFNMVQLPAERLEQTQTASLSLLTLRKRKNRNKNKNITRTTRTTRRKHASR